VLNCVICLSRLLLNCVICLSRLLSETKLELGVFGATCAVYFVDFPVSRAHLLAVFCLFSTRGLYFDA
jgi:hypothetical protein